MGTTRCILLPIYFGFKFLTICLTAKEYRLNYINIEQKGWTIIIE